MTAPVRDWEVVASKFLAALVFYMSLWLPSLFYFLIFGWLGNRAAIGSAAQLWAPYLLLLVMGMFNVALGCVASAMTSNQIVAAMISLVLTIGFFFVTLINYVVNSSSPNSPRNDRLRGSIGPHGLFFARGHRFPRLRLLSEHDSSFAGHHLPGYSSTGAGRPNDSRSCMANLPSKPAWHQTIADWRERASSRPSSLR